VASRLSFDTEYDTVHAVSAPAATSVPTANKADADRLLNFMVMPSDTLVDANWERISARTSSHKAKGRILLTFDVSGGLVPHFAALWVLVEAEPCPAEVPCLRCRP